MAKSHIDIAVYLLQPSTQLLDPIHSVLDPAGQLANLRLEPIYAKFAVYRRVGASRDGGAACTTVDLPLQHAEVPFQSIETVLRCAILRSRRLGR